VPFPEQPTPEGHPSGTEDGPAVEGESTRTDRPVPRQTEGGRRKAQRELEGRQWEAQRERQEAQRELEERQRQAQRERQEAQRELEERQRQAQLERQEAQRELERKQRPGGGPEGT
jgi:colicin import membrane protein